MKTTTTERTYDTDENLRTETETVRTQYLTTTTVRGFDVDGNLRTEKITEVDTTPAPAATFRFDGLLGGRGYRWSAPR
jgi:hypothetical protein